MKLQDPNELSRLSKETLSYLHQTLWYGCKYEDESDCNLLHKILKSIRTSIENKTND